MTAAAEPLVQPLHCRVQGDHGPWTLILHGLFGAGRNWQAIAKPLAEDGRVALVDLRNHGASPWASGMRYADLAADVAACLRDLGAERARLVGHSMGGKVAMWLALTQPELVERLAIVDIAPVTYAHDHANLLAAMRGLDLRAIPNRAAADAALASSVPDLGVRQFLLQNLVLEDGRCRWRVNLEVIAASMPDLTGFPVTQASFGGPALAIVGGGSDYVDEQGERALRRHFPAVRLVRLDGVGHWPHAQEPTVVTGLLRSFLAEADDAVRR